MKKVSAGYLLAMMWAADMGGFDFAAAFIIWTIVLIALSIGIAIGAAVF